MDQQQWKGKARAKLTGAATPDQAWSVLKHFSNIHNLISSVSTCQIISGFDGEPGCVRHCISLPITTAEGGVAVFFADERLISVDHVGRSYTYEVADSNMGFGRYVATIAVVPAANEEMGGECVLEWTFEGEPVVGWSLEGLVGYLESCLHDIARKIEETLQA